MDEIKAFGEYPFVIIRHGNKHFLSGTKIGTSGNDERVLVLRILAERNVLPKLSHLLDKSLDVALYDIDTNL